MTGVVSTGTLVRSSRHRMIGLFKLADLNPFWTTSSLRRYARYPTSQPHPAHRKPLELMHPPFDIAAPKPNPL